MMIENQETKSNDTEKNNPNPPPPPPAIGEPQSPVMGSVDLVSLRRMYGDSYGTSGLGVINSAPQPAGSNSLAVETWFNNTKLPNLKLQDMIKDGIEIVKGQYADFNTITHTGVS